MRTRTWGDPSRWQRDAAENNRQELVFTGSWSDWLHEDADEWRDDAWKVVRDCPNLVFQILTRRPERIEKHLPEERGFGLARCLAGRQHRIQPLRSSRRDSKVGARGRAFHLGRAIARLFAGLGSEQYRLAHRWRRIRSIVPSNGSRLGSKPPRPFCRCRSAIFLQTKLRSSHRDGHAA